MEYLLDQTKFFDTNDYEYNQSAKIGIMLIHGFTNTTYELTKMIDFLASNNFNVCAYNLPGHGTSVQDCNDTTYKEWLSFSEEKFAELSSRCDKVFICGISMGALLAMNLSTLFPVNGLISVAPVLEFNKPFKIHFLNPILCHLMRSRPKKYEVNKGQKIYYGYNKWPLIALNELRKLSQYTYKYILPNIQCPTLLIHSKDDQTSVFNNYKIVKNYIGTGDLSSLIVEQSHHNIFDCDNEKTIIQNSLLDFINKHI
tara:strand:+ start:5405 stop:6172 length:768 start_codon:yes stop_codon:yes gene_type:complete